jgi:hypothetical protein
LRIEHLPHAGKQPNIAVVDSSAFKRAKKETMDEQPGLEFLRSPELSGYGTVLPSD